ncbi:MAG: ABC transporter ATP-binding protein [Deltaproteobacteria bacterium]|nr:ABC transporter ATP-binding protein [Deltaproteobacteria bacterium]
MLEEIKSENATAPSPPQLRNTFDDEETHASSAIEVENVKRRFGLLKALDGVSFSIPQGALCGLIGPNGAGKTTLLSILATLDDEYEGNVRVAGADVLQEPEKVRAKLGFVPDHARIYDGMTVRQFLEFFARAEAIPKVKLDDAVNAALDEAGLQNVSGRSAADLSKGMTQRLCVARALLADPAVLILDEPASGLDPRARIDLKELLKRAKDKGRTVLISSHILSELGDFCDWIVVLEKGKKVKAGAISELWSEITAGGSTGPQQVLIEVTANGAAAKELLMQYDWVEEIRLERNLLSCIVNGPNDVTARLVRQLVTQDFDVLRVVPEKRNLEALFLSLTTGGVQ